MTRRCHVRRSGALAAVAVVLALRMVAAVPAAAAGPFTYVVRSTADAVSPELRTACRTGGATCTLRAALVQDQADAGPTTIAFALSGTGPHTIQLLSALPVLGAGGTTIDGYTQPGSSPNTKERTNDATIQVQVRGTGSADGIAITSAGNTVRGLALYDNAATFRIGGAGAQDNVVAGNYIGTNAAGTFRTTATGRSAGVLVSLGAARNTIGGDSPAEHNVISGNPERGVAIFDQNNQGTDGNVVQGNLVGLTPAGTAALPNNGHGLDVNFFADNTVFRDNVVSGNVGSGIEVSHAPSGTQVVGNHIGTDPSGAGAPAFARNNGPGNLRIEGPNTRNTLVSQNVIGGSPIGGVKIDGSTQLTRVEDNLIGVSNTGAAIGNAQYGVQLEEATYTGVRGGAHDNVIGPDNVIANNGVGVRVFSELAVRNTITRNSIHHNAGLGIDIAPLGSVNANDPGDGDTGPNDLLNFPEVTQVAPTAISGTACGGCRVEVFRASEAVGGHGEGTTFLASSVADGGGSFTVPLGGVASGDVLTTTATDPSGNTSEFGANVAVPAGTVDRATDTFQRTVAQGWGTADTGGAWSVDVPQAFAVDGSRGTVAVAAGSSRSAHLPGVSVRDVDATVTLRSTTPPAGSGQLAGVLVRRRSSSEVLRAWVRLRGDGSVAVGADGPAGPIGEAVVTGLVLPPGGDLRLRVVVTGANPTTIKIKAWSPAVEEPSGWSLTVTDSTSSIQQAGSIGLFGSSQSGDGGTTLSFDDFRALPASTK